MRQFLADLGAGTSLALINDWDLLLANVGIILVRVILELIILRKKKSDGE